MRIETKIPLNNKRYFALKIFRNIHKTSSNGPHESVPIETIIKLDNKCIIEISDGYLCVFSPLNPAFNKR